MLHTAKGMMRTSSSGMVRGGAQAAFARRSWCADRSATAARRCGGLPSRDMHQLHALAVGDKIPNVALKYFTPEGNMKEITTETLLKGKKVVLLAVPGAFTPTCSAKHVPGFVERADDIKARGVDTIACVSVNDAFVMDAWGKNLGTGDKILMLADGNGQLTKAMGVELDLSDKGLGFRSRRFALLADDQVVKVLNLEEGGAFTISSAESILEALE